MQFAQTVIRFVDEPIFARTLWRFGSQRRRVRLLAWLILLPVIGFFPQIAHTFAISES
jgi:hypothetical protein